MASAPNSRMTRAETARRSRRAPRPRRSARSSACALRADAPHRIEQPLGRLRVRDVAVELVAQDAAREGVRGIAVEPHGAAVVDGDHPATRVRAVHRARAGYVACHASTIWVWIVCEAAAPRVGDTGLPDHGALAAIDGADSARTMPARPAAKKFVFDSSVVVRRPGAGSAPWPRRRPCRRAPSACPRAGRRQPSQVVPEVSSATTDRAASTKRIPSRSAGSR